MICKNKPVLHLEMKSNASHLDKHLNSVTQMEPKEVIHVEMGMNK